MADNELDIAGLRKALNHPPTPQQVADKEPEAAADVKVEETADEKADEKAAETEGDEKAPEAKVDKKEKRFSKLTQKIESVTTENAALKARLEALESGKKTDTPAKVEGDGRPVKPDANDPKFETYKEYEAAKDEYDEALADWKADQREKKRVADEAAARAKAEWDKTDKAWRTQLDALREDNDDMEDAIEHVGKEVGRKGIIEVIKESEVGVEMVLYLHRNAAELEKLDGMTVPTAARYLGRIESRIIDGKEPNAKTPATKTAEKKPLPKPPSQVGGSPSAQAKPFDFQNASDADFKAQMRRMKIL